MPDLDLNGFMDPADIDPLEETLAILEDAEAMAQLAEADRAYLEGDVVRGVEAVKALRPQVRGDGTAKGDL